MARHLDLGHDGDEALACVGDDLSNVVLGVEAAVPLGVVDVRGGVVLRPADERAVAPRADFRQPRILLDLDAPALIIGEMPVKGVQLMEREEIDVLLYELLRHEMARDVQVCAAPLESRTILDLDGGNRPRLPGDDRRAEDRWW